MQSESLTKRLAVTAADQALRLRWLRFSDRDAALIRAAAPFLEPQADAIVTEFYDHSFSFSEFRAKVAESNSSRERLHNAQKGYFLILLKGKFDEEYFEHRLRIGAVHAILNVEPRWNVGTTRCTRRSLRRPLGRSSKGRSSSTRSSRSTRHFCWMPPWLSRRTSAKESSRSWLM